MAATTRSDVLAQLDAGVAALTTSERWAAWLRVQSRLPRYSFHNTLLIALTRPAATRVAGYRTWQQLGRQVRRGERGIAILAPVVRRVQPDTDANVDDLEQTPAPIRRVAAFTVAWVWDVAQTDGVPLPEVCTRLGGDAPEGAADRLLHRAAEVGFDVADADLPREVNGECSHSARRIVLRHGLGPAQRVKTLAHELAHAVMHEQGYAGTPRPIAELEAESVAYIVCHALGLDSSDYSLGYVAAWAGGGREAHAAIAGCGQRIQQAARRILGEHHGHSESLS